MSKIYIRADMNPTIASGHIMRCLSIADAAKELGHEAVFLTADEYPAEFIAGRGHQMVVLHSDWKNMEGELPALVNYIQKEQVTKLLIDSYRITYDYLKTLQQYTEVFYLDDLDAFEYPADNVICYANYHHKLSYSRYQNPKVNFYLGTEYMPLRKGYRNCPPKTIHDRIHRILIMSGGSDNFGMIEKITEIFKAKKELHIDIICGAFYPDFPGLSSKYKEYSNLHFYQNVSNLEDYIRKADLAISAGGTTLYELSAMGTPAISYSFADNQRNNVLQFAEDAIIDYAGDARYDAVCNNILALYTKLDTDPSLRRQRSCRMQSLVDGEGAFRIMELLLNPNGLNIGRKS